MIRRIGNPPTKPMMYYVGYTLAALATLLIGWGYIWIIAIIASVIK